MAEYINEEPCEFTYSITAVEKVIDGDTIDAVIDLGFDVRYCGRIRLLGIDTPESRTRNLVEKVYGLLSKKHLSEERLIYHGLVGFSGCKLPSSFSRTQEEAFNYALGLKKTDEFFGDVDVYYNNFLIIIFLTIRL